MEEENRAPRWSRSLTAEHHKKQDFSSDENFSPALKSRQLPAPNTSVKCSRLGLGGVAGFQPDPTDACSAPEPPRGVAAALLVRLCAEGSALVRARAAPVTGLPAAEEEEDQSEWPTSQKDAGGQCLQKQRMRFVERRWSCCPTCAPGGRCRTTTAWISSTTSGTWADRVTRTQVRLPCTSLSLPLAFLFDFAWVLTEGW